MPWCSATSADGFTPAVIRDIAYAAYPVQTKAPQGPWFEVAVIHHTDCGSTLLADDELRHGYAQRIGVDERTLTDTAVLDPARAACLDIVGVVTLAMVSGLGGGIIRDILLGALPSATFSDWRYLAVAAAGGLAASALSRQLAELATLITMLDAAGLGLFAVTRASKALGPGLGAAPAVILGVRYDLNAPMAPEPAQAPTGAGERKPRSRSRFPGLPDLGGHPGVDSDHRAIYDAGQPFMMRVSRAGLSGAAPTPAGDAASPGPA